MKRPKKRRPKLQFEVCEARHLLTSAPIAVNDTFTVIEDTPFQLASSEQAFIETESIWKYLDNGSNQGTTWQNRTFNDNGWDQGPAELGYGDGDEATELSFGDDENSKFATTYFRHHFSVTNPTDVVELLVEVRFDDGVALYLNGNANRGSHNGRRSRSRAWCPSAG